MRLFTKFVGIVSLILGGLGSLGGNAAALPAFPEAEGMGGEVTGGRGGAVLIVNTLLDNESNGCGTGLCTLREAMEATGARMIVFSVAGEIVLDNPITLNDDSDNGDFTIAGQTAPGSGITIRGDGDLEDTPIWLGGNSGFTEFISNVIIRYISVRPGPHNADSVGSMRAINIGRAQNIIIDHVSLSWVTDQINSSGRGGPSGVPWPKVTWSWNIFSEGLARPDLSGGWGCHSDYCGTTRAQQEGHSAGPLTNGDQDVTYHNNYIAMVQTRAPKFSQHGKGEFTNNVIYGLKKGDSGIKDSGQSIADYNIIGNYYKQAPFSTNDDPFAIRPNDPPGSFYTNDNVMYSKDDVLIGTPIAYINNASTIAMAHTDFDGLPVTATSSGQALIDVLGDGDPEVLGHFGAGNNARLDCLGNWVLRQDAIDARVINYMKTGTGAIIDEPAEVGGWATVDAGTACADTDSDGMADEFEVLRGFTVGSDDSATVEASGYTRLEEYLNGTIFPPGEPAESSCGA